MNKGSRMGKRDGTGRRAGTLACPKTRRTAVVVKKSPTKKKK